MMTEWNWTLFFDTAELEFRHRSDKFDPAHYRDYLADLSFQQGLRVIVTSVPQIENQQWTDFRQTLHNLDCPRTYREAWLQVAETMKRLLPDVRRLVHTNDIQKVIDRAENLFCQADAVGKFGMVACLIMYSSTFVVADVILDHLRRNYDFQTQQLERTHAFYRALTPRQRDVALLTAYGYTNREIAEQLFISEKVVSEYLTAIFEQFVNALHIVTDSSYGVRYRLIHQLTRLFEAHPDLVLQQTLR